MQPRPHLSQVAPEHSIQLFCVWTSYSQRRCHNTFLLFQAFKCVIICYTAIDIAHTSNGVSQYFLRTRQKRVRDAAPMALTG